MNVSAAKVAEANIQGAHLRHILWLTVEVSAQHPLCPGMIQSWTKVNVF
jgi:hypothetical protein